MVGSRPSYVTPGLPSAARRRSAARRTGGRTGAGLTACAGAATEAGVAVPRIAPRASCIEYMVFLAASSRFCLSLSAALAIFSAIRRILQNFEREKQAKEDQERRENEA